MHGGSSEFVLLSEYLSVSINNILRVLLEQVVDADVELLVSFDRVGVMEDLA